MRRSDIDLLEQLAVIEARQSFWAYRQYINPGLKLGWWQYEVSQVLTEFKRELEAGNRPKYVIEAPPQHGKSVQIIDFISWLSGHLPDTRSIYTSFSERLGVRANMRMQRIMSSDKYRKVFPDVGLNSKNVMTLSNQYLRNREIIEYVNYQGYFRNTTVRGSITGEGLDLGVIDDPIKGREQAGSLTVRDATWDWFTDDFFSRFSEDAGLLAILTRWHVDDPIGRLVASDPTVKVFKYKAIAEEDEKYRKAGEPLFAEHKSLDFLLERKRIMASFNWSALYQQSPTVQGGELIRGVWFPRWTVLPPLRQRVIYADTAQKTKERHDYSVFELWGQGTDNRIYLIDMIRGKWEAPDLKQKAIDFWNKHVTHPRPDVVGPLVAMKVEDKASGTGLIQDLRREALIPILPIQRNTDKYTRVLDGVGYMEAGYVVLPQDAPFVSAFVQECEEMTADDSHAHDDQIDPMLDAIKDMIAGNVLKQWENLS